jgi:hypothetical protein
MNEERAMDRVLGEGWAFKMELQEAFKRTILYVIDLETRVEALEKEQRYQSKYFVRRNIDNDRESIS